MGKNCDHFQAFPGVSLRYLGEHVGEHVAGSDEKGERSRKKRFLRCRAMLCERVDALNALGSVASYLENRAFILINDTFPTPMLLLVFLFSDASFCTLLLVKMVVSTPTNRYFCT